MNAIRDPAPPVWTDPAPLRVLGMGTALPGLPVETGALLSLVATRFGLDLRTRGLAVARKLGVETRHVCRPFDHPVEGPRPGQRNPELAARAVRGALDEARLTPRDLSYLIGHTATPAIALPANVAQVAAGLDYHGPFAEFRQACTGFVNALVFALGLLRAGSGPVAVVGSETGSVHFDPRRAAADSGPLWDPRKAFWADPDANAETVRQNLVSPAAAKQRHLGTSPHPERYDPDLWTDEAAFLARPGQDRIQLDLFYDYRTNPAAYPSWQAWLRERQPPLLVAWGRHDPSFDAAEAEAYKKDVPGAEVHVLDAGHFALDEAVAEVAELIRSFMDRSVAK